MAKKELRRIKVNFDVEQLELINGLTGTEEWDIPFSIKIEKLIDIALEYNLSQWLEDITSTLGKIDPRVAIHFLALLISSEAERAAGDLV